jgi:hypothetical protein
MIEFVYDDGGREAAGFRGTTGDCVTRAIAIATEIPYREVYDSLHQRALDDRSQMARLELRYGKNARRHASPRNGVVRRIYDAYLKERGWVWVPTMHIGSGCRFHLRADEVPPGRAVIRLSGHVTAVVNGAVHDTYDPSREGTRCVYGWWERS